MYKERLWWSFDLTNNNNFLKWQCVLMDENMKYEKLEGDEVVSGLITQFGALL